MLFFATAFSTALVECAYFSLMIWELQETRVQFLGQEGPLEKGMATQSSILAWRIPWTEEPGEPQSMGSQIVGHD